MCKHFITWFLSAFLMQSAIASTPNECNGKMILGQVEKVLLMPNRILVVAKVDTGAQMSSLSANHIKIYRIHGQSIVKFNILNPANHQTITLTEPLAGFVKIRQRAEEKNSNQQHSARPIVNLTVCIANQKQLIAINLVNRAAFHYAMLIGADVLKHLNVVVDVNKAFQVSANCA